MKRTPIKRTSGLRPTSKKKQAHKASTAGREAASHMAEVKGMPCEICGAPPPSDVHHVIHHRYSAAKPTNWEVIPLCKKHHQVGPFAIHNGKESWLERYGPDWSYLPAVLARVGKAHILAAVGRDADGRKLR